MKPTVVEETITLKQAYDGCVLKIKTKRQKLCEGCDGKGGSAVETCGKCKGQGAVVKMVQLGPGMYTQTQQACAPCKGKGKIVEKS